MGAGSESQTLFLSRLMRDSVNPRPFFKGVEFLKNRRGYQDFKHFFSLISYGFCRYNDL